MPLENRAHTRVRHFGELLQRLAGEEQPTVRWVACRRMNGRTGGCAATGRQKLNQTAAELAKRMLLRQLTLRVGSAVALHI